MSIGTQKFRPYFSASELLEVIAALKERPTTARLNLVHYLDGFAMKIERGTISPQHILKGTTKEQLVAAMGLQDLPGTPVVPDSVIHAKWEADPTSCSPVELQRVLHYRFISGLLTDQEERVYLTNNGVDY